MLIFLLHRKDDICPIEKLTRKSDSFAHARPEGVVVEEIRRILTTE